MKWVDSIAVPLALVIFSLIRLLKDRDSRLFPDESPHFGLFQKQEFRGSSLLNLIALVVSFVGAYLIVWTVKRLWT
jgi:hypothetical protein